MERPDFRFGGFVAGVAVTIAVLTDAGDDAAAGAGVAVVVGVDVTAGTGTVGVGTVDVAAVVGGGGVTVVAGGGWLAACCPGSRSGRSRSRCTYQKPKLNTMPINTKPTTVETQLS